MQVHEDKYSRGDIIRNPRRLEVSIASQKARHLQDDIPEAFLSNSKHIRTEAK